MPTILIRREDTSSRFGVARVLVVAVLACTMLLLMPTRVTAEDAVAPPANVNVCQATTGNCATECLDSTTEVVRTSDATVHCIHAYTTSKAPTDTAADAPPITSFGAAVAAAAAAVGGIRGSANSNSNQTIDDNAEEPANAGVVDTVAAALAYDGRGIDYYDPVTNLPVTMVWDDIMPCTANEIGQCHHPNYPLDDEEEAAAEIEEADDEAEAEEDGADIEAEAEADEEAGEEDEETEEDDEELMTTTTPTYGPTAVTTTPTFAPTAMATTPTVAPTATYRPTSFPTTLYSRTDAQDVCLSSSLDNDCSECTDSQSVVTTGSPAVEYPTYCVKYAGSTRQDTDGGIFYITNQEGGTNIKRFADIPQCAPNDENACHTLPDYSNRACTTTVDDCPNLNNSVEYCAESLGLCVPVGTCEEVDDCVNSDNDGQYAVVQCDGGMMECQNGYCSMNCNPNESSNTNATTTNELEEEEDNDQDNDEEIGPEMGNSTTTLTNTTNNSMETTTVATETNATNNTTTTDPSDDESREDGSLMTVSYSTNEEEKEEDKPLNKTEELDLFFDSMNEYYTTNTDNDNTSTTSNTSTLAINQLETSAQYSASSAAVTLTTTTTTLPTWFATIAVVALCSVW